MNRFSPAVLILVAFSCSLLAGAPHPGPVAGVKPAAQHKKVNLPAGASAQWWSWVQEDIRKDEYTLTRKEDARSTDGAAVYTAPNRANQFTTTFTSRGIGVAPMKKGDSAWQWGLSLVGIGRKTSAPVTLIGRGAGGL